METTKPVEALLREKKIYQIVNPRLVQAPPEITIQDAILLMQANKSGYIVIAKQKKVLGIFSERDAVLKILGKNVDWKKPVGEFMSEAPAILNLKDSVGQAIDLMGQHRFYYIPLVNDSQELANVLSVRTLIRFLAEFYPTEVFNLPPKSDQIMATPEGG